MDSKQLKNAGFKITQPRMNILNVMQESNIRHLSAEDIFHILHKKGQEVALATIYRVLTQFETAGLIIRHNFEANYSVFELASEEHHDHLVCIKCAKVIEFVDDIIEQRQLNIASKYNFKMTDHSLYIYGICNDCNKKD